MADGADRNRKYEYKAKSNIVLLPDIRLIERQDRDDETGEVTVTSLKGKLTGTPMEDPNQRTKPIASTEEREAKRQKRDDATTSVNNINGNLLNAESIAEDVGAEAILYRPKAQETREAINLGKKITGFHSKPTVTSGNALERLDDILAETLNVQPDEHSEKDDHENIGSQ